MSRAVIAATAIGLLLPALVLDLLVVVRGPRGRMLPGAGALLRGLGRRIGVPAAPVDLEALLRAAGVDERVSVVDAMASKVGAGVAAALVALPLAGALPGRLGVVTVLAAPIAGFFAPDLWLRRQVRLRARALSMALPDALDLLRVTVAAGLSPARALGEVGRRQRGLLAAELHATSRLMGLGMPASDALARLEARCPTAGVTSLVGVLRRADRGAPLVATLGELADDVRAARLRAVRDGAARAAPRIQLVIALVLVPGVLALVAAALVRTLGS